MMISEFLTKAKAELKNPFLKRRIKNKAVAIKDSYVDHYKEHPEDFAIALSVGCLALAWRYRSLYKNLHKGFWVEFTRAQLDAMDKDNAFLVFQIDGDTLFYKLFEPDSL